MWHDGFVNACNHQQLSAIEVWVLSVNTTHLTHIQAISPEH